MKTLDINAAPLDGTRIILLHYVRHFVSHDEIYKRVGTAWVECRFISDKAQTGSDPHWEPWCGNEKPRTTKHIKPEDAIAWLPLP